MSRQDPDTWQGKRAEPSQAGGVWGESFRESGMCREFVWGLPEVGLGPSKSWYLLGRERVSVIRGDGPQGALESQEEIWSVPCEEVGFVGHQAGAGTALGTKCQETAQQAWFCLRHLGQGHQAKSCLGFQRPCSLNKGIRPDNSLTIQFCGERRMGWRWG